MEADDEDIAEAEVELQARLKDKAMQHKFLALNSDGLKDEDD